MVKKTQNDTLQSKKATKARGPKPGSARSNQSVKYSKDDHVPGHPSVKPYTGPGASPRMIAAIVGANKGKVDLAIMNDGTTHQVQDMYALGIKVSVGMDIDALQRSFEAKKKHAALEKHLEKQPTRLANGLNAHNAPHSARAAAEKNKSIPKAEKRTEPKAGRNKAKANGTEFGYKIGKAADRKPGTWTQHMLEMIQKATDTAAAKAAHVKSKKYSDKKLHFSWARDKGYIKY